MQFLKRHFALRLSCSIFVAAMLLWVISWNHTCGVGWTHADSASSKNVLSIGIFTFSGDIALSINEMPRAFYSGNGNRHVEPGLHVIWQQIPAGVVIRKSLFFRRDSFPVFVKADGSLSLNASGKMIPSVTTLQYKQTRVEIPLWLPLLLSAIYPTWILLRTSQRRQVNRFAAGQCVHCGYDLRASPQCCPECGRVPIAALRMNTLAGGVTFQITKRVFVCGIIIAAGVGSVLMLRTIAIAYNYRPLDFLTRWN